MVGGVGLDSRYLRALNQISCLSFVGQVIFISLCGVETITLYWHRPGGMGLGSSTDLTPSIYALFALDSEALDDPGSAELQYNVLVYGCTQKNLGCLRSPWPLPIARRVYLYKNSPIIVWVIAWMIVGSVPWPFRSCARGVISADLFGVVGASEPRGGLC